MMTLKQILRPPVFEKDEDNHQAYLLNLILWGLVVVPIPYVLYYLIAAPQFATRALIQGGVGEAINIFLLILMRRGHLRLASYIQVTAF